MSIRLPLSCLLVFEWMARCYSNRVRVVSCAAVASLISGNAAAQSSVAAAYERLADRPCGLEQFISGNDGHIYGAGLCWDTRTYLIFRFDPPSTFTTLHTFTGTTADTLFFATLIHATDGNFYGTVGNRGANGRGLVFGIDGTGQFLEVHSFSGSDGAGPTYKLVQSTLDGRLYGTTTHGGIGECPDGCGTLYSVGIDGTFETLHFFDDVEVGRPTNPLMEGRDGAFYGMTVDPHNYRPDFGMFFRFAAADGITTLYRFNSDDNLGVIDDALVETDDGTLWGAGLYGGVVDFGTVFAFNPSASSFGVHGEFLGLVHEGGLLKAANGDLYGAMDYFGDYPPGWSGSGGAVFRVTDSWVTFPHVFAGNVSPGYRGALINAPDGNIFGLSSDSVFRLHLGEPTSLELNARVLPASEGIRLTVVVGAFDETPVGDVEFYDDATLLAVVPLSMGSATLDVPTASEYRQWSARYLGAADHFDGATANPLYYPDVGKFLLRIGIAGDGIINVSRWPSTCQTSCSQLFDPGTSVTLAAVPEAGYVFAGWSGACSGRSICTIAMDDDKEVLGTFAAGPDLIVISISNPPSVSAPGTLFTVTDTTRNAGADTAGESRNGYFLSITGTSRDLRLVNGRYLAELLPGQESTGNRAVKIPATTSSGSYWLIACADNDADLTESNEANNCLTAATQMRVGHPDLRQTAVSTSATFASPGGKIVTSDTVDNPTAVTAVTSMTRFYLSPDALKNGDDILLTGKRAIPELSPGEVNLGSSTLTLPSTVPDGTYYVIGCADDLAKIKEVNETNNCAASPTRLLVGWADLVTTAVSDPPATALRGGKFTVSDTVRNQGTIPSAASYTRYYLSVDDVKGAGDVPLVGTRAVASLAAGASSPGGRVVTVASTTPVGTYRVLACADDTAKVPEQDNVNNCRGSVATVTIR
jgi:uncharacterized repeat protein (TIGR03803 family)